VFLITKSFVELSPKHSLALEVMVSGICGGRRYELCYGVTTSGLVDCTQYINRPGTKKGSQNSQSGTSLCPDEAVKVVSKYCGG